MYNDGIGPNEPQDSFQLSCPLILRIMLMDRNSLLLPEDFQYNMKYKLEKLLNMVLLPASLTFRQTRTF